MKWLREVPIPDFERHRKKVLLMTAVRVGFYVVILGISLLFQIKQNQFFDTESFFPLYLLLITSFALNAIYLAFFNRATKLWQATAFLFAYDTVFITALILATGVQQSIFLFLYLVNIILCGFVFQRRGATTLALFTSACFSVLLILGPEIQGQTLYYAIGLNNLAFFAVAILSGYLSEQLNFMGVELTARKRDLKVLKDLNKVIVENMTAGLITVDIDNRIVLSNKAAHKILGHKAMVGLNIDQVFSNVSQLIREIDDRIRNKSPMATRFERRYNSARGDKLTLGFSISPLLDAEDQLNGHIIIFQDLTDIAKLEAQMRRQEKLAAVGKLAAGIAHEIRNPLASISGSIELLKASLRSENRDEVKLMEIVLREIDRLNGLISEFLDFVRPEERKDTPCDINKILKEVLDMVKLNGKLNQSVTQEREFQATGFVPGDKNKLKQVFLNLVINAYQSMNQSKDAKLFVGSKTESDVLTVKIRDTGCGMNEGTLKRLFEPFFTTKPSGTGLGLATAHKILETHDARIFVESREGNGTEFTIQFNHIMTSGAAGNESQNTGS